MTDRYDSLYDALIAAPNLAGARCAGRWELWDDTTDPEVIEYTTNQCQACPSIEPCQEWVSSLKPSKRPVGVVAGKVRREAAARNAAS